MTSSMKKLWGGLALMIAAAGLCGPALAGEEATVKEAFAAWVAQGASFETGPKQATFVGSLTGPVFVESDKGPVQAGRLTCPAIVEIGLDDGKETAEGRCTITARDGARLFAQIKCAGVFMIGCRGDMTFTGGTERFNGITGGGKVTIRAEMQRFVAVADQAAAHEGTGILAFTDLHYKIP